MDMRRWALILAAMFCVTASAHIVHATGKRTASAPSAKTKPGKRKIARPVSKGRAVASRGPSARPSVVAGRKVAVLVFKGEGSDPVRLQVVNVLRAKGLDVTTTLRPVDSAVQYRDMATALGLAAYVYGEVRDDGEQARVTVHIRSGVSGQRVKSARFSGSSRTLPNDINKDLWAQVGPTVGRVCADAATKPRRQSAPMRIEAGTPIENTPVAEGT
jgi:hypothetical protein